MMSFASNRSIGQKSFQAKGRPGQSRLHVEELEDRVVPSFFPPTTNGIHIFEDQLPNNLSAAMTQFVATHLDGTQKELLNQTQQFRAINPNFTVLHYQLGTGNSPYQYIINNQWASDWNTVNQQESWFAHQSYSGEPQSAADLSSGRVGNSTGWDQADIANPAWQQYSLNQVLQNMAATGSNGWFADSFTFGFGGAGYTGTIPTRYQGTNAANPADWPGGVTWANQLANWAQGVESSFSQANAANGTDYQFIPNLDALVTSWAPNWYDNASGVPFIDGAFLEHFGEDTDPGDWTLSMNRALNLTNNGKIVIMQPYPSAAPNTAAGQQKVNFYLGTYLLLKGTESYLNIDYNGGVQYYPQYELNLGTAVTPLQNNVSGYLWNGVYRRDFQNGFVLVNPGSTTYNLNLGGAYQLVQGTGGGTMTDASLDAKGNYIGGSLSYQTVNNVTLTGGSAAVFLNNAGAASGVSIVTVSAVPFNGVVANFSDANPSALQSDSAKISWGDGITTAGSIVASGNGTYQVTGSHTYSVEGRFTISVQITEANGSIVPASSTATVYPTILLLDPSGAGALSYQGPGKMVLSGGSIHVNSTNSASVSFTASAGNLYATNMSVGGNPGLVTNGGGTFQGQLITNAAPDTDYLASLPAPIAPSQTFGPINDTGSGPLTLQPGTYNGSIAIGGSVNATMQPGLYYIKGGSFSISQQATLAGAGVMIYEDPSNSSDAMRVSTTGHVNLSPQTSGVYRGIVYFDDRANTSYNLLVSNGSTTIVGLIYAASAKLVLVPSGGLNAQGTPLDTVGTVYDVRDLMVSSYSTGSLRLGTGQTGPGPMFEGTSPVELAGSKNSPTLNVAGAPARLVTQDNWSKSGTLGQPRTDSSAVASGAYDWLASIGTPQDLGNDWLFWQLYWAEAHGPDGGV
jgi:hypothetical protein